MLKIEGIISLWQTSNLQTYMYHFMVRVSTFILSRNKPSTAKYKTCQIDSDGAVLWQIGEEFIWCWAIYLWECQIYRRLRARQEFCYTAIQTFVNCWKFWILTTCTHHKQRWPSRQSHTRSEQSSLLGSSLPMKVFLLSISRSLKTLLCLRNAILSDQHFLAHSINYRYLP